MLHRLTRGRVGGVEKAIVALTLTFIKRYMDGCLSIHIVLYVRILPLPFTTTLFKIPS